MSLRFWNFIDYPDMLEENKYHGCACPPGTSINALQYVPLIKENYTFA
jgi:hypothetical protein